MQRTKSYVSVDPRPFAHRDRFSLSSWGSAVLREVLLEPTWGETAESSQRQRVYLLVRKS